ncbi:lipase maturation factor family protein [Occallatibacter savannae]|uniref:lipase maturation factor family protein n=1 Tax=Occallatibacter savannae TaxID=1002691 RepID=UPI000D69AA1B|nr:lipase maturation factor family protein [Occallatibacter savannae]
MPDRAFEFIPTGHDDRSRNSRNIVRSLFDSTYGAPGRLAPRWIFLRALAAIYFSAFYSLLFQIKGLIGPEGILPAHDYLPAVARAYPVVKYWFAPTLFWISSDSDALMVVTWIGLLASIAAFANLWPRLNFFICFVCFLSFVSAAQDFSNYQSDGMLLEAGFIALFFSPRGLRPRLGEASPPSRASIFLLQWEWFRIYFESGLVKIVSGDRQWRTLTAMDHYYETGPLPTWIGWYTQHLPHRFHAASAAGTLILELGLVWMLFLPRRFRIVCFFIVTPWEIGVILTANYTFLNYLVLSLGFLLLDDGIVQRFISKLSESRLGVGFVRFSQSLASSARLAADESGVRDESESLTGAGTRATGSRMHRPLRAAGFAISVVMLTWICYNTTAELIMIPFRSLPLPTKPIALLEPFRIANQYGLFAVMTNGRYEIEFQGSDDGQNWKPYFFRYKPQMLNEAPRIFAPYQPRFDWNLWFASLGDWRQNEIVPITEERLLDNDPDVVGLFRINPFPQSPPRYIRAILWQYWFTSREERRATGNWWRRELLGMYAPELTRTPEGQPAIVQLPEDLPVHN